MWSTIFLKKPVGAKNLSHMRYEKSRVRTLIDLAPGEKEKLRIVVRGFKCVVKSGSDGFDTALATSGLTSKSTVGLWSRIGSNVSLLPNSVSYHTTPRSRPGIRRLITEGHSE